MSVKDRCVSTYKQVLNILVACWSYGSSKLSSQLINKCLAFSTASIVARGGKLGGTRRSLSRARDGVGSRFFLGAVTLSNSIESA
jgi:hypothetical protein